MAGPVVSRRKRRKRLTTTRAYKLGDRHRFANGEGRCTGIARYHNRTVFYFVLPHLVGRLAHQMLLREGRIRARHTQWPDRRKP